MPTAAKLVSTILFALVAYAGAMVFKANTVAGLFRPVLEPETWFGVMPYVSAGIGALCGWFVMGQMAGRGLSGAIGAGVLTVAAILFFGDLTFALHEMILQMMKMRYAGPVEAIQGLFGLFYDYGRLMIEQQFLATVLISGVISALLAEATSRAWR